MDGQLRHSQMVPGAKASVYRAASSALVNTLILQNHMAAYTLSFGNGSGNPLLLICAWEWFEG